MRLITLTAITGSGEDMFDGYLETQTETAEEISKTFSVAGFNAVVVLNNYGIEAELTIGSEVMTVPLIRDSIKDWWDYFFAPSRIGRDCVFYFPLQGAGVNATLKIKYPDGTAKCGMCVTGVAKEIMTTKYDVEIGISDYSKYVTNEFGQIYLNQGPWAKKAEVGLFTLKENFDIAFREIIKNRATPCVFDYNEYDSTLSEYHTSEEKFSSLVVYGYTDDFSPTINTALANITHSVKGLI